jgi:hypothetical protein
VRVLLIHNPNATKTTAALIARIARVFSGDLKLEVAHEVPGSRELPRATRPWWSSAAA